MNADQKLLTMRFELDFWLLEVHKERDLLARRFQVVDTLRHMLVTELIDTLQLEDEITLDDQVRDVFADALPL